MAMNTETASAMLWNATAKRDHLDALMENGEEVSVSDVRDAESAIRWAELQWMRSRQAERVPA